MDCELKMSYIICSLCLFSDMREKVWKGISLINSKKERWEKWFRIPTIFHVIIITHTQPLYKFKTYVQFDENFPNNFFNLNFNQFYILAGISLNDNWIKKVFVSFAFCWKNIENQFLIFCMKFEWSFRWRIKSVFPHLKWEMGERNR